VFGGCLKKINLILGIHNHQPVGNFDFVFEEAYQKSYSPFMKVNEDHPQIKLAQHYTGILFEWIDKNHPEFIKRLKKRVKQNKIEMLTGGFYEPILATIPDEDKVGQIKKLSSFVKEKIGYEPLGAWLAERVWEPHLPQSMAEAGVKYTVIDDAHFKYSGLREDELFGYYITEHNGSTMNIFPISERLRYTIPFRPVEETFDYLRSIATEDGERLVVFADDGEKFGVWPGTYEQCYEQGWLDQFFSLLEDNMDWIDLMTFKEALEAKKPQGRIYLPTASYREMMEWALPARTIPQYEYFDKWLEEQKHMAHNKVFVRGGFWRNFFVKYPESNNLHKRMLFASNKIKTAANQKQSKSLEEVKDHLYAAQCNCPYWHGVFGGLYLPHLRNAIYSNLIQADKKLDGLTKSATEKKNGWVDINILDFDADGADEIYVETDRMNLLFCPSYGGGLFELDYKPKNLNLIDTMARRQEGYHHKLTDAKGPHNGDGEVASIHDSVMSKEENLDKYLNYDWHRRISLLDHFLHPQTTLETFATVKYGEQGDFINQPFKTKIVQKSGPTNVIFERNGRVWIGSRFAPIFLRKTISMSPKSDDISVKYMIKNMDSGPVELWFAPEFVFSLLAGNAPDRYYTISGKKLENPEFVSTGIVAHKNNISLTDEWMGIRIDITTSKKTDFWRFPIETISMSEAGFERVYQCSVVLPNWKINLQPGQKFQVNIKQSMNQI
jgi:4-alpha-glucanotransferase